MSDIRKNVWEEKREGGRGEEGEKVYGMEEV